MCVVTFTGKTYFGRYQQLDNVYIVLWNKYIDVYTILNNVKDDRNKLIINMGIVTHTFYIYGNFWLYVHMEELWKREIAMDNDASLSLPITSTLTSNLF